MKNKFFTFHIDSIGFSASVICAIHCALMPLVLSLLPLAGLKFLENPIVEYSLIAVSLVLAGISLIRSYIKVHKDSFPLKLLAVGFALILLGHFLGGETQEAVLTSIGGLSIALAHYINWNYKRDCETCKN